MTRRDSFVPVLVGAVGMLLVVGVSNWYLPGSSRAARFTSGPTVKQLEELGQLVSYKVHVADVLATDNSRWRGSWLIRGDALLAVDMRKATISEKNDETRHASIVLPPPAVIQPRVDHERTLTWNVEKTSWIPRFFIGDQADAIRDGAMAQAQLLVQHAANSNEYIDEARARTVGLLRSFYALVGWDVDVQWTDE